MFQMIQKCLIQLEIPKKFDGKWRFLAVVAVSSRFLHNFMILFSIKATTIPHLCAVTNILAEFHAWLQKVHSLPLFKCLFLKLKN